MKIKNNQGSALIIVLIILMVSTVLLVALMSVTTTNQKVQSADRDYSTLHYATEGILSYEVDKIKAEIEQIYKNNNSSETDFKTAVRAYLVGGGDFKKDFNNYDSTFFNASNTTVDIHINRDTDSVYTIYAEGKKQAGDDSIAPRKMELYTVLTLNWVEPGGSSDSLKDLHVWLGGDVQSWEKAIELKFKARMESNKEKGKYTGNIILKTDGSQTDIISAQSNAKMRANLLISGSETAEDLFTGNPNNTLRKQDFKNNQIIESEYKSPVFPASEADFYNIIDNNNTGLPGGNISVSGAGELNGTNVTTTFATSGDGVVNLNDGTGATKITVTHENGGEFYYSEINVNTGDELTIYTNKDLEIYCNNLNLHDTGKILFEGTGKVYFYVKYFGMSSNTILGRESEIKDTVFLGSSWFGLSESTIKANVFTNASNVSLSGDASIEGLLIGSTNTQTVAVHDNSKLNGGLYTPKAHITLTTNGTILTPLICNRITMENNSLINLDTTAEKVATIINDIESGLFGGGTSGDTDLTESKKIKKVDYHPATK